MAANDYSEFVPLDKARSARQLLCMPYAQFTVADGCPIAINPDAIESFGPEDDGTRITLRSGASLSVREGFDVDSEMLGHEGPGGC